MASFIYNSCLFNTFRKQIDFENDNFKLVLLSSAYRPDKDHDEFRSDLMGEVSGAGYTQGGISTDIRVSMSENVLSLSLGSIKLPNASVTARYGVYVRDGGSPEDDDLIACIDFGGDVTSTHGDFTVTASTFKLPND